MQGSDTIVAANGIWYDILYIGIYEITWDLHRRGMIHNKTSHFGRISSFARVSLQRIGLVTSRDMEIGRLSRCELRQWVSTPAYTRIKVISNIESRS